MSIFDWNFFLRAFFYKLLIHRIDYSQMVMTSRPYIRCVSIIETKWLAETVPDFARRGGASRMYDSPLRLARPSGHQTLFDMLLYYLLDPGAHNQRDVVPKKRAKRVGNTLGV